MIELKPVPLRTIDQQRPERETVLSREALVWQSVENYCLMLNEAGVGPRAQLNNIQEEVVRIVEDFDINPMFFHSSKLLTRPILLIALVDDWLKLEDGTNSEQERVYRARISLLIKENTEELSDFVGTEEFTNRLRRITSTVDIEATQFIKNALRWDSSFLELGLVRKRLGITPDSEKPFDLVVLGIDQFTLVSEIGCGAFIYNDTIYLPQGADNTAICHEYVHSQRKHLGFGRDQRIADGLNEAWVESRLSNPREFKECRELLRYLNERTRGLFNTAIENFHQDESPASQDMIFLLILAEFGLAGLLNTCFVIADFYVEQDVYGEDTCAFNNAVDVIKQITKIKGNQGSLESLTGHRRVKQTDTEVMRYFRNEVKSIELAVARAVSNDQLLEAYNRLVKIWQQNNEAGLNCAQKALNKIVALLPNDRREVYKIFAQAIGTSMPKRAIYPATCALRGVLNEQVIKELVFEIFNHTEVEAVLGIELMEGSDYCVEEFEKVKTLWNRVREKIEATNIFELDALQLQKAYYLFVDLVDRGLEMEEYIHDNLGWLCSSLCLCIRIAKNEKDKQKIRVMIQGISRHMVSLGVDITKVRQLEKKYFDANMDRLDIENQY
jgi:hypothetical protein